MSALSSSRNARVSSSVIARRSLRSAPAQNALSPRRSTTTAQHVGSGSILGGAGLGEARRRAPRTSAFDERVGGVGAVRGSRRSRAARAVDERPRTRCCTPRGRIAPRGGSGTPLARSGRRRRPGSTSTASRGRPASTPAARSRPACRGRRRCCDAHPLQHVDDVLGGDVAGRAGRVGAAAEPAQRGVDGGDAHLDRRPGCWPARCRACRGSARRPRAPGSRPARATARRAPGAGWRRRWCRPARSGSSRARRSARAQLDRLAGSTAPS